MDYRLYFSVDILDIEEILDILVKYISIGFIYMHLSLANVLSKRNEIFVAIWLRYNLQRDGWPKGCEVGQSKERNSLNKYKSLPAMITMG